VALDVRALRLLISCRAHKFGAIISKKQYIMVFRSRTKAEDIQANQRLFVSPEKRLFGIAHLAHSLNAVDSGRVSLSH
jgi:hypothetical protein